MNRFISVLIPLIVLVAMGLVLFQQMMTPKAGMRVQNEVKAFVPPPPGANGADPAEEAALTARTAIGRLAAQNADQFTEAQAIQDHDGEHADMPELESADMQNADPLRPNLPPAAQVERREPASPAGRPPANPEEKNAPQTPAAQAAAQPEPQPARGPEKPKDGFVMKNLTLQVSGSEVILKMQADKRFEYRYFLLTGPNRLVVDLPGDWKGLNNPRVPSNQLVKSTRYARFGDGYRFVLDLNEAPRAQSDKRSGNVVEIRLSR